MRLSGGAHLDHHHHRPRGSRPATLDQDRPPNRNESAAAASLAGTRESRDKLNDFLITTRQSRPRVSPTAVSLLCDPSRLEIDIVNYHLKDHQSRICQNPVPRGSTAPAPREPLRACGKLD